VALQLKLAMSLPRDRASVPLTRRVLDAALSGLSVTTDCRADIGLVVGEACANAVQHASFGREYNVSIMIHGDRCVIDVMDGGSGAGTLDRSEPDADDEAGRGLRIIRALADAVELRRRRQGAVLRIVKILARHVAMA
jgi:serine/threonine-protein kinase RsbW